MTQNNILMFDRQASDRKQSLARNEPVDPAIIELAIKAGEARFTDALAAFSADKGYSDIFTEAAAPRIARNARTMIDAAIAELRATNTPEDLIAVAAQNAERFFTSGNAGVELLCRNFLQEFRAQIATRVPKCDQAFNRPPAAIARPRLRLIV